MAKERQEAAQPPAAQAPATKTALSLFGRLGERYGVPPGNLLATMKDTVFNPGKDKNGAPKAPFSDTELVAALILAEQYDLNPFAREIYVARGEGGRLLVIVPVDGWSKIVNRRNDYDGVDFEHIEGEGGKLKAVTGRMYVKGRRRPVEVTEWMSECYRDTGPWNSHPRRMLRHKAYIQTARIAFGLAGIVDDDEAERILDGDVIAVRGALAGGKQPGYLSAPQIAEHLPLVSEITNKEPVERSEESTSEEAAPRGQAPETLVTASAQAPPSVDEGAERRTLWLQYCKLRPRLTAENLKELKESLGVETIEPSASLDLLAAAVAGAQELIK